MEDYPSIIEGRREERHEGRDERKNMKRGYESGKGIKQTKRLNVSSEVHVKGNKNLVLIVKIKEK